MYDDSDYANSRIRNTVVMWKRSPVFVFEVLPNLDVKVSKIQDHGNKVNRKCYLVPLGDLNILDFNLGYVNNGTACHYLYRRALRRDYKQGLHRGNVGPRYGGVSPHEIAQALRNRYLSFSKTLEKVMQKADDDYICNAWCSDFCIDCMGCVLWRGMMVGAYSNGIIQLELTFSFLKSTLKESLDGSCKVV